jgi:hypothetical protein
VAYTGGMIALVPSKQDAAKLAVPGGDPVDQMHTTLAFLGGDVTGMPKEQQNALHRACAVMARQIGNPIGGTAFGHAVFNPTGDNPAHVYMVNGPLTAAHHTANAVGHAVLGGDMPVQHEPFIPHVTAGYNLPAGNLTHTGPVKYDRLRLALGDTVHDFPLGEPHPEVKLSAETPALAATPHLLGTHGLWGDKSAKLPNYIEQVAAGLEKAGHSESESVQLAIGAVQRWARGEGKVTPEVRAAATAALAEWERLKATHNKTTAAKLAGRPLRLLELAGPAGYEHGGRYVGGRGLPAKDAHGRAASPATRIATPVKKVTAATTQQRPTGNEVTMAVTTTTVPDLEKAICARLIAKGIAPAVAAKMAKAAAAKRKTSDAAMSGDGPAVELAAPMPLRAKARKQAASDGAALPDGSWPIRNRGELKAALENWGHAVKAGNTATVKAHMVRRAKALGVGAATVDHIQRLTAGEKKLSLPKAEASLELATWNNSQHPRRGKGKQGGEFRPKTDDGAVPTPKPKPTPITKRQRQTNRAAGPPPASRDQAKQDLAAFMDRHPEQFIKGQYVTATVDHKGEHRLAVAGSALALVAALSGVGGRRTGDERLMEPPDEGPSASEMYEQFKGIEDKDSTLYIVPRRGKSRSLSNEIEADMSGGTAHTVVETVKGTPIVRLDKDWADMTPAERDALLAALVGEDD